MSMYGSVDITFTYDGHVMTPYVLTFGGISIEQGTVDAQAFQTIWNAMKATGNLAIADLVLEGFFDDVASGPKAEWAITSPDGPNTAPKNLVIVLGGSNSYTVPVLRKKWEITGKNNDITRYRATLTKGVGDCTIA